MYRDDTIYSGNTFCVNSAKMVLQRRVLHNQFVHETLQLICNKCKFKKNIQGYINKHIICIFEGKLPQCEFCHDMPTPKAALAKHIYLYMAWKSIKY